VFILGRRALTDVATWSIFVVTIALVLFAKEIAEPVLILSSGVVGIVLQAFVT
jgi:chromate transport protein ChrA